VKNLHKYRSWFYGDTYRPINVKRAYNYM
jgi:hypothetical protein